MIKFGIVTNFRTVEEVENYLPSNYRVIHQDQNGQGVLICGEDNAGWTLDDYVIPRLGSGLLHCKQVWPVFTNVGETGPIVTMDVPERMLVLS